MSVSAPKLFISYRREETAGHAGRLYDAFAERFGEENVFMDVGLDPGVDFVKRIKEAVGECRVLVAVIGPRWATLPDDEGRLRLADPEDFVRVEVETALRRPEVTVIPALVGDARMPDPDDLPEDLRALAHRNAVELSDLRWRYDVGQLTSVLERLVSFTAVRQRPEVSASEIPSGADFAGYRIEEVAGRGGMGVVYRATQLTLDRTVALKLIAPDLAEDESFRERFKRESHMAASIEHPHVIPVYEAGEAGERLFIAMRYIDGSDLRRLIRGGPLAPGRAAEIVGQIASALDAAHRRGLVHRDVKPANILIADEGGEHAYLTDFGLTKSTTSAGGLTATGQFVGTADYTAPEQILGNPTDARTDVYALGCVLYHALIGHTVFQRDSEVAVMYAHLHEPPPRLTAADAALPEALDGVIQRAMAKDPDERYPSAGDLGSAAEAALGGGAGKPEHSVATGEAATVTLPSDRRPGGTKATREGPPPISTATAGVEGDGGGDRTKLGTRRALAAAGGAACLVILALIATGALSGGGDDDAKPRPPPPTAIHTFAAGGTVRDITARAGTVVWVRNAKGGVKVRERRDGRVRDLPVGAVLKYAGMDLGTDSLGQEVLIASSCPERIYTCKLYVYSFDSGRPVPQSDVATKGCDEISPSISGGTIAFSRGARTSVCDGGTFVKPRGASPVKLGGRPATTDLSQTLVAWGGPEYQNGLRVARSARPTDAPRLIEPSRADPRSRVLAVQDPVLDGRFLYFLELTAGERFFIARVDALRAGRARRYGVSFTARPHFAVDGGDLLYSGNARTGRARPDTITRDDAPVFR